jgi:hypothetical protein
LFLKKKPSNCRIANGRDGKTQEQTVLVLYPSLLSHLYNIMIRVLALLDNTTLDMINRTFDDNLGLSSERVISLDEANCSKLGRSCLA